MISDIKAQLACGARAWCGACVACLVLAVRGSRGRLSVVAEQVTGLDPGPDPSRGWARGRTVGRALSWARGPSREILDSKTNHGGSRSSRREGQGETGGPTTS